jgi:ABC-2 type transport system permease protein
VAHLISGFRWSFFGKSDVDVVLSFSIILAMLLACLALISWMIRTGWRLRH